MRYVVSIVYLSIYRAILIQDFLEDYIRREEFPFPQCSLLFRLSHLSADVALENVT
jgi:hypothetical protein